MEPDDYKITIGTTDTITISTNNTGDVYFDISDNTLYTVNDTYDWISISDIDINTIDTKGKLFEDHMPDPAELERMCAEYPGLDKAYENFKTFYKLVEQDWRGKQKNKKG